MRVINNLLPSQGKNSHKKEKSLISIIISTRKSDAELTELRQNIAETIGVEYELIIVDNNAKYSLAQAYNLGVEKANYFFFFFLHDDILFQTKFWGQKLTQLVNTAELNVGLIGVAGTKIKAAYPSGWGQSTYLEEFRRGHIFSEVKKGDRKYFNFDNRINPPIIEDVVCVDGVLLFTNKNILAKCSFDEIRLNNFHCYYIYFLFHVFFAGYRVLVDREIELIHFSGGNYSSEYNKANKAISEKWKKQLPAVSSDVKIHSIQIKMINLCNSFYFYRKAFGRKILKLFYNGK